MSQSNEIFDPRFPGIGFRGTDFGPPQDVDLTGSRIVEVNGQKLANGIAEPTQGVIDTLTGNEGGTLDAVGSWVGLLLGRDSSLASRVAAIENRLAVGSQFYDNFKRGDNDSVLGSPDPATIAPWVQFGDGESLGIHDQAAQMTRSALPDDGIRYARCPFLALSPDYAVGIVVHPKGTPNQPRTSIYARCNADMTEGVYVDFYGNRTRIGRFTRVGLTVTRSQWGPEYTKAYSNSSTPQLRMSGTNYQVIIDDVVIIDHTDTSNFPVDMAHVTSGFSVQCWTALLQLPQWSGMLAAFAVRGIDQSAIAQATHTANTAASTANDAATAASNAEAAAGAVLGVAENAEQKAALAQETAEAAQDAVQDALDGAQQQGKEWMVASGGVVLGRNEVNIGPVIVVPTGRDRRITSITYGLESNTGTLTIELVKVSPTRVSTVIHTANIQLGVVEAQFTNLNIPIENGYRLTCNVTYISATASVLLCSVDGALL
ncbi:hypothetical protein CH300_20230 [Rhodococcus sp. 15-1154-1]|nr:hypothetical protein [Rhodococcus sp. 15-1154-1]OZF00866.1 hypothetical protein CH300_20230 [Rhodococcus sp. 15-1154-1]